MLRMYVHNYVDLGDDAVAVHEQGQEGKEVNLLSGVVVM